MDGTRGELGWTYCVYFEDLVEYIEYCGEMCIYIVYIENCWAFLSAGCSIGGWMKWKEYLCSVFSTCV